MQSHILEHHIPELPNLSDILQTREGAEITLAYANIPWKVSYANVISASLR